MCGGLLARNHPMTYGLGVIATQDATRQINILQMISKEIVEATIEPKECKSKTGLAYFYEKCGFKMNRL